MLWHVVRAHPGREIAVVKALKSTIEVFCPLRRSVSVVRGRKTEQLYSLFPGYLFASWVSAEDWHRVIGTDGVAGIIGGEFPTPIPLGLVESWRDRVDSDDVFIQLTSIGTPKIYDFNVGDPIIFTYGAFESYSGVCLEIHDETVTVKFSLLGRPLEIYVPANCCRYDAAPRQIGLYGARKTRRGGRGRRLSHTAEAI